MGRRTDGTRTSRPRTAPHRAFGPPAAAGWAVIAGLALICVSLAIGLSRTGAAHAAADPTATPTTVPFLQPPFAREYRITSYFDHQLPDYTWDDTIVLFNGDQASAIDGIRDRTGTFKGGYYLPDTRWFVYYDGHNGYDYGTGAGTTILAAAPGEVVFAGSVPSNCDTPLQLVRIRHDAGHGPEAYYSSYLHLDGICVRQGDWVETGDPLGISGNTGCSLGPHLHFAVRHGLYYTDPRGWRPTDAPDPQIAYSGKQATWLWAEQEPLKPVGRLALPAPGTPTNGDLVLRFVPDADSPPVSSVRFVAFYEEQWHHLGQDGDGSDGWSLTWDTRGTAEGEVWVHAWASGEDGRTGKGSPIVTEITIDRHPPQGTIVGLEPDSVAGSTLWLYAASFDPASTTKEVTLMAREQGSSEWQEIGDAAWLHTSNWLLQWAVPESADGTSIDVVARLTDGAGNSTLTEVVHRVTIDRAAAGGGILEPPSGLAFSGPIELAFAAAPAEAELRRVDFYVWYGGSWHAAGADADGSDGWRVRWDPRWVAEDWVRMRVQARVTDAAGRVITSLAQATDLTLDRTAPKTGLIRPATGGVARPGVPLKAWAADAGSGVAAVVFYVNEGAGWIAIGRDDDIAEGWTLDWDGAQVGDGSVDFTVRAVDRAGNEAWANDARDVALDRLPPGGQIAFPQHGARLSGEVTVRLEVADEVSGLDRAVFYAWYGGRWHHLGADYDPEDGFELAWDTAALDAQEQVSLGAWVYDRAGNHIALPAVEELSLSGWVPPTPSPTSTLSPTAGVTLAGMNTPVEASVPEATATPALASAPTLGAPAGTGTPAGTDTPAPTVTPSVPTATTGPPATFTSTPDILTSTPQLAEVVTLDNTAANRMTAFWWLVGSGAVVALVLLAVASARYGQGRG